MNGEIMMITLFSIRPFTRWQMIRRLEKKQQQRHVNKLRRMRKVQKH